MKLKKIASLMLAGVMAVSMLAGCSSAGKDDNGGDVPPVTTTGMAAEVNEGLSKDNQKMVSFTNSGSLTTLLNQMIEQSVPMKDAAAKLTMQTGESYNDDFNDDNVAESNVEDLKAVTKVYTETMTKAYTTMDPEAAAIKDIVKNIDDEINGLSLAKQSGNPTVGSGDKYATYAYTAEISDLVAVTTGIGSTTTTYYVVYTITQTPTVHTA